jgi:hypothetical protein
LEATNMKCLRRLLGIRNLDKQGNTNKKKITQVIDVPFYEFVFFKINRLRETSVYIVGYALNLIYAVLSAINFRSTNESIEKN